MHFANTSAPIFIHSSFRTSSTWVWSKFRADPAVIAYYEYFHEILQSISVIDIDTLRPNAWESGHRDTEPYFVEYLPLLRKKGFLRRRSGVDGFRHSMAFANFFPEGGYDGSLSKAELTYIKRLIAHAAHFRRAPCFACKRSLGRVRALKRAVGGTHIVLQRKLLHQWRSYREQANRGNSYFLCMLLHTVALNEHEPFMALVGNFIRSRPGGRKDILSSELDNDDLFVVFVVFHFYLYLVTFEDADLIIRTSDLADPDYRRSVVGLLQTYTGLHLDFSDARELITSPHDMLDEPQKARLKLEKLCDRALCDADKSVSQAEALWSLLNDIWSMNRSGGAPICSQFECKMELPAVAAYSSIRGNARPSHNFVR